ncbi:hypothetical protein RFI_10686 [Reticulomyxa filosa]|uniref:Thiamin pyrophosphokinase thiamin-binding domain-containing protein n=1 Tax=Reticulomyxa filosa TaxID=46433 RepID=X6NM55_RETFI|nr:hypothetical protein RFI_10686 [Reticulomyxa filosa]|eukprot:ETO26452.1 hypothetical protein RFI_10686 [Reticulomyxa filosa]
MASSLLGCILPRFRSRIPWKKRLFISSLCTHVSYSFRFLTSSASVTPNGFYHDFTFLDRVWDDRNNGKVNSTTLLKQPLQTTNLSKSQSSSLPVGTCYDVIVLNCPADEALVKLCEKSRRVICADGGGNTMYRLQPPDHESEKSVSVPKKKHLLPYAVVGDMDSIERQTLDYFVNLGVKSIYRPSSNNTDFYKALSYELETITESSSSDSEQKNPEYIIAWGAYGERFDHEMQSFNILKQFDTELLPKHKNAGNVRLMLMSGKNFCVALGKGTHKIRLAKTQGPICGVLPIYEPVTVTTFGLKWDLKKSLLSFGGLVSSSNEIVKKTNDEPIVIETDGVVGFFKSFKISISLTCFLDLKFPINVFILIVYFPVVTIAQNKARLVTKTLFWTETKFEWICNNECIFSPFCEQTMCKSIKLNFSLYFH